MLYFISFLLYNVLYAKATKKEKDIMESYEILWKSILPEL